MCNLGECDNASYSSQSSLKQHIRTMHEKKYKFNCKKCSYGTDNQDCLTSHRINKHKDKFVNWSGKKVEFKCKLCYKVFDAPHLLRKHERTMECTAEKHYHALTVAKCSKLRKACSTTGSSSTKARNHPAPPVVKWWQKSMPHHMKIHSGQRALQRAKDFKAKAERRGPSTFDLLYWPRRRSLLGRRQLHLSLLQPK